jgi:hypothetical protein
MKGENYVSCNVNEYFLVGASSHLNYSSEIHVSL